MSHCLHIELNAVVCVHTLQEDLVQATQIILPVNQSFQKLPLHNFHAFIVQEFRVVLRRACRVRFIDQQSALELGQKSLMRLQNALCHQLSSVNLLQSLDEIEGLFKLPQGLLGNTSTEDPLTNVVSATFHAAWEAESAADSAAAFRAASALLSAPSVVELVRLVALLD